MALPIHPCSLYMARGTTPSAGKMASSTFFFDFLYATEMKPFVSLLQLPAFWLSRLEQSKITIDWLQGSALYIGSKIVLKPFILNPILLIKDKYLCRIELNIVMGRVHEKSYQ